MKLKAMKSSFRMAGPLKSPDPNPFVTHRGLGAFTESDFRKPSVSEQSEVNTEQSELSQAQREQ